MSPCELCCALGGDFRLTSLTLPQFQAFGKGCRPPGAACGSQPAQGGAAAEFIRRLSHQTRSNGLRWWELVLSGRGGWGCEFVLCTSYEFSHHTQHQPALAGFGVSDREFIHGGVSDREFIHGGVSDREFIHGGVSDREFIHGGVSDREFIRVYSKLVRDMA